MVRLVAGLVGCAQMAALVAVGGYAPLHWALFGLISVAMIWLSHREAGLYHLPSAGLAIALLLAGAWASPTQLMLAAVVVGIAAIYGVPAVLRLWRADGSIVDAVHVAAIAAAILLLPMFHFYASPDLGDDVFAVLALLGAAISGGTAALGWRSLARKGRWPVRVARRDCLRIAHRGRNLALPIWAIAPWSAIVAGGLLLFGQQSGDRRLEPCAWGFAAVTLFSVGERLGLCAMATAHGTCPTARGGNRGTLARPSSDRAALRPPRRSDRRATRSASRSRCCCSTSPLAQTNLANTAPTGPGTAPRRARIHWCVRRRFRRWSLASHWSFSGRSCRSQAGSTPQWPRYTASRFFRYRCRACSTPSRGYSFRPSQLRPRSRRAELTLLPRVAGITSGVILGGIATHTLFKQLLDVDSIPRFIAVGMAERTLWEAALAAVAFAAWRLGLRWTAMGLAAASLAHFAYYTLLLHNPLWSAQSVGIWLIPAYGIAFAILHLRRTGELTGTSRSRSRLGQDPAHPAARHFLVTADLRWITFDGEPGRIGRGHLPLGSRCADRNRLSAMGYSPVRARLADRLVAADARHRGKGVPVRRPRARRPARVASFAALGFSLIGLGWLYSRYLPDLAADDVRRWLAAG